MDGYAALQWTSSFIAFGLALYCLYCGGLIYVAERRTRPHGPSLPFSRVGARAVLGLAVLLGVLVLTPTAASWPDLHKRLRMFQARLAEVVAGSRSAGPEATAQTRPVERVTGQPHPTPARVEPVLPAAASAPAVPQPTVLPVFVLPPEARPPVVAPVVVLPPAGATRVVPIETPPAARLHPRPLRARMVPVLREPMNVSPPIGPLTASGSGSPSARREEPRRPEDLARPEKLERPDRRERPDRPDRFEKANRAKTIERMERPERPEGPDAADKLDRLDRSERAEKLERVERVKPPEKLDRLERVERPERLERPEKVERPERVARPERLERVERVERFERIDGRERAERPQLGERPERSGRRG